MDSALLVKEVNTARNNDIRDNNERLCILVTLPLNPLDATHSLSGVERVNLYLVFFDREHC